jgi:uncharacterized protein YndB with AHSA1/START domain
MDRTTDEAPDREIVSTRTFDASRERLFEAFVDPHHLSRWWGPKGFTNTFQEFDPRPGGPWKFVMHGPNGVDYPNRSVFLDVVPPERIVLRHVSGPEDELTVTLAEEGTGTRLTWRMAFNSAAEREKVAAIAVPSNEENFDRLAAELSRVG